MVICERTKYEFLPLVFASTGAFHKEAIRFFEKILGIIVPDNNKLKSIYRLFWSARFACALQKSIAFAILSKSKIINGDLTHSSSYQLRIQFLHWEFPGIRKLIDRLLMD